MAALPRVILFFLLFSTWAPNVFSGLKPQDPAKWPPPPCELYFPVDPSYIPQEPECPQVFATVCTTSGNSFQNECYFCLAQWEFGSRIKFLKYGKC